jgi:hypothetical protein
MYRLQAPFSGACNNQEITERGIFQPPLPHFASLSERRGILYFRVFFPATDELSNEQRNQFETAAVLLIAKQLKSRAKRSARASVANRAELDAKALRVSLRGV